MSSRLSATLILCLERLIDETTKEGEIGMSKKNIFVVGDTFRDCCETFVTVAVVRPPTFSSMDFVVAIPHEGWEKNGFLQVATSLTGALEYLRNASQLRKFGVELLQPDWVEAARDSVLAKADPDIHKMLRDRFTFDSSYYLDGCGAPHHVNMQALLKVKRGDWTFLSAAQRTLALRRQKDFTHSRIPSGKDRNRSGSPAMTHAAPKTFFFTSENLTEAKKIIAQYPAGKQASAVLPLLDLAQRQNANWLPSAAVTYVADLLEMPAIKAFEVASFYTMFNLQPVR